MKLHVNFDIGGLAINETIEGETAADITRKAKLATAGKLGFLAGAFLRSMPDGDFSREVVRRYNAATGSACPLPSSMDEFVSWAIHERVADLVE